MMTWIHFYAATSSAETPESDRRLSDRQIGFIDELQAQGKIEYRGDYLQRQRQRNAEMAGVKGKVVGSILTLTIASAGLPNRRYSSGLPRGIRTEDRFTEIIEVNINNLAAVPSVVFGILKRRCLSASLAFSLIALGRGFVLALMTLPTIIISSRAALKRYPSIRDAALGMGASRVQVIAHHVLPLAMPGMLTGTIIGMAQALGETAPLLMIGMVAFIVDTPTSFVDPGQYCRCKSSCGRTSPSACTSPRPVRRF